MILYALKCATAHEFDSWFLSSDAFDTLRAGQHVSCPICGSVAVEKSLMAPSVRPARKQGGVPQVQADSEVKAPGPLSQPGSAAEVALADLRRQIEANSDYVGLNFAAEARRIHDGSAPPRSIYGEARPEEARQLIEDGVPVTTLPFVPVRKTN